MSNAQLKAENMTPDDFFTAPLSQTDSAIYDAIKAEDERQQYSIELIPSENIVSQAV